MQQVLTWFVIQVLSWEARLVLRRRRPRIIAVTGSVGKTTTKDAIFAALEGDVYVRKSEKTYNNEFGVPLTVLGEYSALRSPLGWLGIFVRGLITIFGSQPYPAWLIVEVGADRPGDIRRIARWLRPDIAVITGVPEIPVHVEFFRSPEEVVEEKAALAEEMRHDGTLIINGDDEHTRSVRERFRARTVSYGFSDECDVIARRCEIAYEGSAPVGVRFRAERSGASLPVFVRGALGRPRVYAALGALAVAEAVGLDLVSAAGALAKWEPTPGRMRILPGIRGSLIIDDTYNSSPAAALAALETLAEMKSATKRIAVLGDMLELGKWSAEGHRQVGERAAKCADMLVTVGFRARTIAEAARDHGMGDMSVRQYEQYEAERAGKELEPEMQEGVVVLVKGSQSMRMERTVLEIMAEPERAGELLVRQEPEWLAR